MYFIKLEEAIRSAIGKTYGNGHIAIYMCFMQTIDLNGHFIPTEILYNGDTVELLIETNRADYDVYANRVLSEYSKTFNGTTLTVHDSNSIYDILADHISPTDYVKIFFSMDIGGEKSISSYKLNEISKCVRTTIDTFIKKTRFCIRKGVSRKITKGSHSPDYLNLDSLRFEQTSNASKIYNYEASIEIERIPVVHIKQKPVYIRISEIQYGLT